MDAIKSSRDAYANVVHTPSQSPLISRFVHEQHALPRFTRANQVIRVDQRAEVLHVARRAPSRAEQIFDFAGLEADDGLTIHDCHRGGHPSKLLQLVHRGFVSRDVPLGKRDLFLPKELLQLVAEQSTRLRIHGHGLRHSQFLYVLLAMLSIGSN